MISLAPFTITTAFLPIREATEGASNSALLKGSSPSLAKPIALQSRSNSTLLGVSVTKAACREFNNCCCDSVTSCSAWERSMSSVFAASLSIWAMQTRRPGARRAEVTIKSPSASRSTGIPSDAALTINWLQASMICLSLPSPGPTRTPSSLGIHCPTSAIAVSILFVFSEGFRVGSTAARRGWTISSGEYVLIAVPALFSQKT
mmetsp:Transcript_18200/g.28244  ORF Transcript_18200/g.28244 Transcript_18200/m.28244 type:complete len:204 (+) Transcript_18200:1510-2121(+)